jgi:hypothetical protein
MAPNGSFDMIQQLGGGVVWKNATAEGEGTFQVVAAAMPEGFCAFQGCLKNRQQLAEELVGSELQSQCNAAEVMLKLYLLKGPLALMRIRGRFSLCIYDVKQVR